MKSLATASLLLFLICSIGWPTKSVAETERGSAGTFEILMENGQSRAIQYNARLAGDGRTTGQITFRDNGPAANNSKPREEEDASDSAQPFYAKAECDCLIIEGVEAVIGGIVKESSRKNLIGQRVLVVVQDGDSLTPPLRDKLTFGFYRMTPRLWLETDGERADKPEPAHTWVATDAERPDEIGIINQKDSETTCATFPLGSHSFVGAKNGKGQIEVKR